MTSGLVAFRALRVWRVYESAIAIDRKHERRLHSCCESFAPLEVLQARDELHVVVVAVIVLARPLAPRYDLHTKKAFDNKLIFWCCAALQSKLGRVTAHKSCC